MTLNAKMQMVWKYDKDKYIIFRVFLETGQIEVGSTLWQLKLPETPENDEGVIQITKILNQIIQHDETIKQLKSMEMK